MIQPPLNWTGLNWPTPIGSILRTRLELRITSLYDARKTVFKNVASACIDLLNHVQSQAKKKKKKEKILKRKNTVNNKIVKWNDIQKLSNYHLPNYDDKSLRKTLLVNNFIIIGTKAIKERGKTFFFIHDF